MIRKLLMVAAAAAVPLGAIAVGAVGGGVAGAKTLEPASTVQCATDRDGQFRAAGYLAHWRDDGIQDGGHDVEPRVHRLYPRD